MKYAHTNIVASDWKRLVQFYCDVFACTPVPPERNQSGDWLVRGTGVRGAEIQGMHLRLPGYGETGPTLEIYQYKDIENNLQPIPNRKGLGHLAFEVGDVAATVEQVLLHGGSSIGELAESEVENRGKLTFVYMADPEGNILEIQHWN
ncbi:MAG: VOC family protein [Aureliella sp.]